MWASIGGNRDRENDLYGASTVLVRKSSPTKLLEFGLKGNNIKMKLESGCFGVPKARMIMKELASGQRRHLGDFPLI